MGSQPQSPCLSSPAFGPQFGALGSAALCAIQGGDCSLSLSLPALSIPPLPPSLSSLLLLSPPSSPFPFPLLPLSLLHAPSPPSQSQCWQLELNLIPLQFKGEQTRLGAQATVGLVKAPGRAPPTAINKDAQFCPDFRRKAKGAGEGVSGRWSQRQLPSSLKKKKNQFAKGRKSASRLLPRKCPGTAGEFRSCLVPFCV